MRYYAGVDPGGGSWGSGPPPPFGGPPNSIKREKMSRACARMARILVLNIYVDPPLSEILYPPLDYVCIYKHITTQLFRALLEGFYLILYNVNSCVSKRIITYLHGFMTMLIKSVLEPVTYSS